eukprot:CAMPEP_0175045098 /NCGR_PEP_ID=MMETSP0052_2-20121109/4205_1 /TAXON_ID=51329 ORGANISM="Polytomella parva, Strain SAG 63-3" /NCGR_SAMPLE_ID=MMETSP0052_2 /ASSEMBLY_ACC=CAM_ASM_000194 /LENGTH=43 /DNA_ID= /DNA_START= /DNA_END= /DNA_ORIENTATION=
MYEAIVTLEVEADEVAGGGGGVMLMELTTDKPYVVIKDWKTEA